MDNPESEEQYSSYPLMPAAIGAAFHSLITTLAHTFDLAHTLDANLDHDNPSDVIDMLLACLASGIRIGSINSTNAGSPGATTSSGNSGAQAQVPAQQQPAGAAAGPVPGLPVGSVIAVRSIYSTSHMVAEYGRMWDAIRPFLSRAHNLINPGQPVIPSREPYAIICGYRMNSEKIWKLQNIWINNKALITALSIVFEGYPGLDFNTDTLRFSANFLPFSHRRARLRQFESLETNPKVRQALKLLREVLEPTMEATSTLIRAIAKTGTVTFDELQSVFCPGETILTVSETGARCAGLLCELERITTPRGEVKYRFALLFFDWDGQRSGCRKEYFEMRKFEGHRRLEELSTIPLKLHPDHVAITNDLIARGRRFESLRTAAVREYRGMAKSAGFAGDKDWEYLHYKGPWALKDRVILDPSLYYCYEGCILASLQPPEQLNSHDCTRTFITNSNVPRRTAEESMAISQLESKEAQLRGAMDLTPWSDKQCLLSLPYTYGFSLSMKRWYYLDIDNIEEELTWDDDAMSRLIFGKVEMDMLTSYIPGLRGSAEKTGENCSATVLVSGPTGSGKRMLAHAVSEKLHRPLYTLDNSNFGDDIKEVERQFSKAASLCKQWNAVLLLEDAERFLSIDSSSPETCQEDLNQLAAFHNFLSFFEGIMIISAGTSIRVSATMSSHIDVMLGMPPLNEAGRTKVWAYLLKGENVCHSQVRRLAKTKLNGREIMSVVESAHALAARQRVVMTVKEIDVALVTKIRFDAISSGSKYIYTPETTDEAPKTPETTNCDIVSVTDSDSDWDDVDEESATNSVLGNEDDSPLLDGAFYFEGDLVHGDVIQTFEE